MKSYEFLRGPMTAYELLGLIGTARTTRVTGTSVPPSIPPHGFLGSPWRSWEVLGGPRKLYFLNKILVKPL